LGGEINETIRQRLNELDEYCNRWKGKIKTDQNVFV
jgi:hypothetical protein